MFIELHLLQSFAPSNLNRDDTGSPKDCDFGGARRARISSQCLKRAIRTAFREEQLIAPVQLAERTRLGVEAITQRLVARGHSDAEARSVAEVALRGAGFHIEGGRTEYLLFLGNSELDAIASLCQDYWSELASVVRSTAGIEATGKARKQVGREALPREAAQTLVGLMNGGKAVDIALFGRMLADLPLQNVEAASQVAHAISTHTVSIEFDFFTAVDDLQPQARSGAGMMGTMEFTSSCFYRYANVDIDQLTRNLSGDHELAIRAAEAFITASVHAIPAGKQSSTAAQNLPALVMAVVRDRGLWSLANAFERPVQPTAGGGLIEQSIKALDTHWGKLTRMYGTDGLRTILVAQEEVPHLELLGQHQAASVAAVVGGVRQTILASGSGGTQ